MYENNIQIYGKHATYMKELVAKLDSNIAQGIFKRNLDVYLLAPIVGKLYNRKSNVDRSINDSTSIHTEQMNRVMSSLETNYRTIMLLEERENNSLETRMDNAFKYDRKEDLRKPGDEIFNQYVLGGIEVLHEKLIEGIEDIDQLVERIFYFFDEFQTRYEEKIDFDEIEELCSKSSK